jgi:hypothetical protein
MSSERETSDSESAELGGDKPKSRESMRAKKKAKRPKPPVPKTEAEIDAPDRQTLFMLGVMCVVTLVLWGFARGACNYHPPRETRRPRVVKTEELARDPKDAALEMQQRLLQRDFTGALELSTGEARKLVEAAKAKCESKPQDCAMERQQGKKNIFTRAELLERNPGGATARVISTTPAGKQTNILKLERAGTFWKVNSSMPDDGSFKPATPTAIELTPTPATSVSAAPGGSAAPTSSGKATLKFEQPGGVVKAPPAAPKAPPVAPAAPPAAPREPATTP